MPAASTHKRGLAITPVKFGISFTATFYNQAGAVVLVYRDGTVQVNHGGTEMGQGLFTKILQIAADSLGVPASRVRVMSTRTDKVPNTSATAASSGSDLNGAAVQDACLQIKARLAAVAAAVFDCESAEVQFDDGIASARGTSIEFGALCETAYKQRVPLFAEGFLSHAGYPFRLQDVARQAVSLLRVWRGGVRSRSRRLHGTVPADSHRHPSRRRRFDLADRRSRADRGRLSAGRRLADASRNCCGTRRDASAPAARRPTSCPRGRRCPRCSTSRCSSAPTQPGVVMGSKAVGEPPLMLALSVREALRDAIAAFGDGRPFTFDSPATPERIFFAVRQRARAWRSSNAALPRSHFSHPDESAASRHQRSPGADLSRGRRPSGPRRPRRRLRRVHRHSRRAIQARQRSIGAGGSSFPDSWTRTCIFRRCASSARWGGRSSTGSMRLRCRKKRGWPTAGYAAETAALFLRALASHGTTTALVFGAHFADATAELFEAAAAVWLRVASGLVLSDRLLRPDLHITPERAYRRERDADRRYHKRGPPVVRRHSALCATRRRKRCSRSASS